MRLKWSKGENMMVRWAATIKTDIGGIVIWGIAIEQINQHFNPQPTQHGFL